MSIINPNLKFLRKSYYDKNIEGCLLEGSSRSGKTWAIVDFLLWLCSKKETNATIHILKETYNSFKTTLFEDFQRRLPDYEIHDSPFGRVENISRYNLFGNNIHFLSTDKPSKTLGSGCDYFWMNEILEISKAVFDQKEQRCRKFWWGDYNPSFTDHWLYDATDNRPDVQTLTTTFLDNPFVSAKEKKKILSYELTPENINNGTADEFLWKVYGLGQRGAMKGQIFKYVTWIEEFPDIGFWYAMDFGFTNDPTCLVKVGIEQKNLYLELLIYEPIENPALINSMFKEIGIRKTKPIISDSSDKYTGENKGTVEMVKDLKKMNWKISKVKKTKYVNYWISKLKEYKIHIVINNLSGFAKKEQQNYKWREINGIQINQPVDNYNHFWDSARYGLMGIEKKSKIY